MGKGAQETPIYGNKEFDERPSRTDSQWYNDREEWKARRNTPNDSPTMPQGNSTPDEAISHWEDAMNHPSNEADRAP